MTDLLPTNLQQTVASTPTSDADTITDLQGRLQTADDALTAEQGKVRALEVEVKILEDNSKIKESAVKYAKWALVIIPSVCLFLLFLSGMGERKLIFGGAELDVSIDIENYAQAALIVAPIAFFATVVGFLLKGAFSQAVDVKNLTRSDLIRLLDTDI